MSIANCLQNSGGDIVGNADLGMHGDSQSLTQSSGAIAQLATSTEIYESFRRQTRAGNGDRVQAF